MASSPPARTDTSNDRPRFRGRRLKTVLVTAYFLLLAISMALFTYRVLTQDVEQNMVMLKQQANVLAGNIATTSAEALLGRDYTAIEQQLLRAIQFPGIDEIQVADVNGKVLSDVINENGKGQAQYGAFQLTLPEEANVQLEMHEGHMVIWQPVFLGDLLGWVRITQSLSAITAIEKRIWTANILFGLGLLAATVILVMLLLHKPMLWLRRYAEFADRLGGQNGEQIGICTTSSELESLGQALNRASGRLYEQSLTIQKGMDELERLAAFPENNPDIVLSLNHQGSLLYLNPYGKRLLADLDLTDEQFNRLLPENYLTLLKRCQEHGKTQREIEAKYGDRTFLWSFSPIRNHDLLHCYGNEITDQKHVEEYAKKALIDKSAAEAANNAKSMFLANMSHEIRTPLTAIIGFSEALLNVDQRATDRAEAIETIHRAGKHLLTIINDILDLSKVEAGRLEVERLPVPLFDLVDEVAALTRLQTESKNVRFVVEHVFPLPATVHSDPIRMRQILLNLCSNAVKFTDQGTITLRLRYDATRRQLALQVEDTGIGINGEQLSRMFTPFTQADASTARRFGGTGLGLTLSRKLAELLGGTISVESTSGEGSCFTFTLDAGSGSGTSLVHHERDIRTGLQSQTDENPLRLDGNSILVAEDNPDNQRLITLYARNLGIEPVIVENGEQAVTAASAKSYDLILMDMQMPVMDGLTATRTLRAAGYSGPIVALTANATLQYRQSCVDAGCNDFLTKPIERTLFYRALAGYLAAQTEPVTEHEVNTRSGNCILIADDNPDNQRLISMNARLLGFEFDIARNGEQAVSAAMARRYSVVLMDMQMPVMDGFTATRVLRAAGYQGPIVAMTAVATLDYRQRCLDAGCNDFIARPIVNDQFRAELEKYMDTGTDNVQAAANDEQYILSELLDEGPEMVELITYFLGRLPGYVKTLSDALAANDTAVLKKQVHDLKSVGAAYGYPQVTRLAAEIEASLTERPERTSHLIEEFTRLATRILRDAERSETSNPRHAG